jgi:hypothetical protein
MAARTYAIESAAYRTGFQIDLNQRRLKGIGFDYERSYLRGVEEYAIECSIIKILGTECIGFVSDEGV